jgi:GPH family glycoside/pentoside/hexuronide:cation symporter
MSNIETFYFMTFLTDLAGFAVGIAAAINSVFSIIDACLSWIYGGILNGTKAKRWGRYRSWLILTPWIVPFIYAFQFVRIGDNTILSAVHHRHRGGRLPRDLEHRLCRQRDAHQRRRQDAG